MICPIFLLLLLLSIVSVSPVVNITSGSSWLYVEWNAQSATFRVLYRESGAPDYQVIVPRPSQLSHNISALQPNTLYNIVVEATHTLTQVKVNSSVTSVYTVPAGEFCELMYECRSTHCCSAYLNGWQCVSRSLWTISYVYINIAINICEVIHSSLL